MPELADDFAPPHQVDEVAPIPTFHFPTLSLEKPNMSRLFLGTALTLALVTSYAHAADTESLKQGDSLGAFYVTKVAGAEEDGVSKGQELCYRCRYGSRPMAIIFARDTGGDVAKLAKTLDEAVAAHEDAQLKSFVTLLGDDASSLNKQATKFAKSAGLKNLPVVVAKEAKDGPGNYKLSADAPVTVVIGTDSQVVSTHTFDADDIDINAVMSDINKALK